MAVESKSFRAPAQVVPPVEIRVRHAGFSPAWRRRWVWAQVVIAFLFVECAVWAARLSVRSRWAVVASVLVVFLALVDRPSNGPLGLGLPNLRGIVAILAIGTLIASSMIAATKALGGQIPANPTFPNWGMAWKYVLWAMLQQFLLQCFFFARCEELFGSKTAVWVAGTLFSLAHQPNMILTSCTLFSGLLFCELFRRYRNIYPLGIIHAALGLTLSSTVPESLLQHMRVGIGYLQ